MSDLHHKDLLDQFVEQVQTEMPEYRERETQRLRLKIKAFLDSLSPIHRQSLAWLLPKKESHQR